MEEIKTFYCPMRKAEIAHCIRGYKGMSPIFCQHYKNKKCTYQPEIIENKNIKLLHNHTSCNHCSACAIRDNNVNP